MRILLREKNFYNYNIGGFKLSNNISGVMLPIITPFKNGEVDYDSYTRLINNYIEKGISAIIPLATTGEIPAVSDYEYEKLVDCTVECVNKRIPIYIGAGGNYTKKLIEQVKILEKYEICGILSVSPYYNRPDQRGIYEHFKKLSESTPLDIIIYNIPYRTGRNIENETILRLSEFKNIVGIKDCCSIMKQTMELLRDKPDDFSVMTGDDILFYINLCLGGQGGIMSSAHIKTEEFIKIYELMQNNNHNEALKIWDKLSKFIPYLFEEPSPGPIKFILKEMGMIDSDEVRLPMMNISKGLKDKINNIIF